MVALISREASVVIVLPLLFLSIAGLPPFLGFYLKLYLINDLLLAGETW